MAMIKKPTLQDVADRAGVCKKTASKVFRNDDSIRPKIKERVQEAAKELNYKPNGLARALKQDKLNIVSFHLAELNNPFFGELFEKVNQKLNKIGYMTLLCDGLDAVIEANQNIMACGTILANGRKDKLDQIHQDGPVLTLTSYEPDLSRASNISIDFKTAYDKLVQEFLEKGYRHFSFCAPEKEMEDNLRKRDHVAVTLQKNGLAIRNIHLETILSYGTANLREEEVLICSNDIVANEVLHTVKTASEQGIVVVGCDGILDIPELVSIKVDIAIVADNLVHEFQEKINGREGFREISHVPSLFHMEHVPQLSSSPF